MDKLIVFRKAYEYLFWLRPAVERFARVHKYSLGIEMQSSAMRLLRRITQANYATEKADLIHDAIVEYEVQRIYLRLAFEYKLISPRQFEFASARLEEIAKLLHGWLRTNTKLRS